jgi:hypothetical protein
MPKASWPSAISTIKTLNRQRAEGSMVGGISGFKAHPDRDMLTQYSFDVPVGTWLGTLQAVAWGKSHNLLCYFTSEEDGSRYILSTFWNSQFRPHDTGPEFDKEAIGSVYQITTAMSKNGRTKFVSAELLDDDD